MVEEVEQIPETPLDEFRAFFFFKLLDDPIGGICLCHQDQNGMMCVTSYAFDKPGVHEAYPDLHLWTLDKLDPITLSPSLICNGCGLHGWIKEGMWICLPRIMEDE